MSAIQVARVLKKIETDCYQGVDTPEYYDPFFTKPIKFSFCELTILFEAIEKKEKFNNCFYEKKLYDYLVEDKEEYGDDFATKYILELQSML